MTIYIGNLSFQAEQDTVDLFSEYGEVKNCSLLDQRPVAARFRLRDGERRRGAESNRRSRRRWMGG